MNDLLSIEIHIIKVSDVYLQCCCTNLQLLIQQKKSFRSFLTACLPNSEKLNSLMHPLFTSCHCVIIHLHAGRIIIHLQAGHINNILVSKSNNGKLGADCTVAILARGRRVARTTPLSHNIINLILFCLYFLHRLKKIFLFVYC